MYKRLREFQRKQIISFLTKSDPDKLVATGYKKVIPAFRKLAKQSPAYRTFLKEHRIDASSIQTLDQFTGKVPILKKEDFFTPYSAEQLLGKQTKSVKLTMTSSGFSNAFAYGFLSKKVLNKTPLGVDTTFDYWFDISNRKSFFINCMPMGLHVETSLPMAEVSVRSDMAIALLKKVAPIYDQTILVGDPHFVKKLVEEGCAAGIPWGKLKVNIITGQDWLPENLRSYLSERLEINLNENQHRGIYATMGMTEMGLNVFHESFHTVQLRRNLMKDSELAKRFGCLPNVPPCIFHYYPFRTYIETAQTAMGLSELVFTTLDQDSLLPMVRYATGDTGSIVSYQELATQLSENYSQIIPDLKLPLGFVHGRVPTVQQTLRTETIKEGLYANPEVVPMITGLFGLNLKHGVSEIHIHLNPNTKSSETIRKKIHHAISQYVSEDFSVVLIPYYNFTEALSLNYEQKLAVRYNLSHPDTNGSQN